MEYKAFSALGNREDNEDSYICIEYKGNLCFVIADGLGGHGKGKTASQKVTEVFKREFEKKNKCPSAFLKKAFMLSQECVISMQQDINEMRTTAVALVIIGNRLAWGHIGDSRLYHFNKSIFIERTIDHSVAQALALSGDIIDADIASHPDRNRLLHIIGERDRELSFDISKKLKIKKGDAFMLCSDGIWELISHDRICAIYKNSKSTEDWLNKVVSEAEQNGINTDMDNYTVITVII